MIHVHVWGSWVGAAGRKTEHFAWRQGMTAEELVPPEKLSMKGLCLFLNRTPCAPTVKVYPGDHLDVAVRPQELFTAATLTAAIISNIIVGFGAIFVLNKIIAALLGKPKGPKQRGDEESPHGAWSGVGNVRVEGQPRPVVYGQFRVAPVIIDEFIVTQSSPPKSTLYMLGAIGEGPVYQIGDQTFDNAVDTPLSTDDPDNPIPTGIQINGNNLENFKGAEVHVRMGANEQDPIPGFELIATDFSIGAKLAQEETATAGGQLLLNPDLDLTSVVYNSNAAGAQALWDEHGFGFDMTAAADLFTCLVEFPSGLYSINSSGSLINAGFRVLIRYKELDPLGDPLNAGGDNGDGYVYVYPEPMLLAKTQNSFGKEYSGTFFDPSLFEPGSLGRGCFFDGVDDYATTNLGGNDTIQNAPTGWAAGVDLDEITMVGWVQFDGLPDTGGSDYRPIAEISDPGSPLRGIALFAERLTIPAGDGVRRLWKPVAYMGNGVSVFSPSYPIVPSSIGTIPTTTAETSWHHVALTYRKISASSTRVYLYLDGVRVLGDNPTTPVVAAGKALEMARSRTFEPGVYSDIRLDEWKVYDRLLTDAEIALDYDGGVGVYGSANPDLVAGWHFEEAPAVTTAQDYGNYASSSSLNDLKLNGGAGMGGIGTGKVAAPGAGPKKRSRYRVEMLRLNMESSSTLVSDDSVWSVLYGKLSAQLSYPNLALIGTKVQATDQLSGAHPKVTVLTKGVLCPVWDGSSTTNPAVTYQWTKNPAWICLDIATNTRYGHGAEYTLTTVDLDSIMEWAVYCDEFIYDNRGNRQAIDESDTDAPIFDLRYNSTLFDGYGGIEIHFRTTPSVVSPPTRWAPGRAIGFTGIPAPSGSYTVDINTSNIAGFEIGEVNFSSNWQVVVRFDKATYGHPWTDGGFLSTSLPAALTGQVEGRERRFEYSWVHDTFKSFWDTLIDVAATARATPMRDGRILRFRVDKPRTPVGMIGMGSIKPGSWDKEFFGQVNRVNSFQADFWDEDKNYDRSNTSFDDPDLEGSASEDEINRESITIEGITSRSQMRRDLYYRIQVHKLLKQHGKFATGLEGLPHEVGDILQVAHDVSPHGLSGRLLAGSTTTAIKLDREVTIASGETYSLRIKTAGQAVAADGTVTDRYETGTVSTGAGTYPAGTSISVSVAFTFTPAKDDTYCLFTADEEFLVQLIGAVQTEDLGREFEWVQYDEDVYDVDVLPQDLKQE